MGPMIATVPRTCLEATVKSKALAQILGGADLGPQPGRLYGGGYPEACFTAPPPCLSQRQDELLECLPSQKQALQVHPVSVSRTSSCTFSHIPFSMEASLPAVFLWPHFSSPCFPLGAASCCLLGLGLCQHQPQGHTLHLKLKLYFSSQQQPLPERNAGAGGEQTFYCAQRLFPRTG